MQNKNDQGKINNIILQKKQQFHKHNKLLFKIILSKEFAFMLHT